MDTLISDEERPKRCCYCGYSGTERRFRELETYGMNPLYVCSECDS